ncbi:hypothetical protein LX32DRAFT_261293 [Colletotrichum zoysiae]|uniref:Uncharacterized protein n=1 Tax=Colletotrichum zoysiae TaxID=1216348 RepID=A0AAD9HPA9_9PEZI|nr:hypothetical protein LX32DRAFT_261293 [Colletotrichum zoysiae]
MAPGTALGGLTNEFPALPQWRETARVRGKQDAPGITYSQSSLTSTPPVLPALLPCFAKASHRPIAHQPTPAWRERKTWRKSRSKARPSPKGRYLTSCKSTPRAQTAPSRFYGEPEGRSAPPTR